MLEKSGGSEPGNEVENGLVAMVLEWKVDSKAGSQEDRRLSEEEKPGTSRPGPKKLQMIRLPWELRRLLGKSRPAYAVVTKISSECDYEILSQNGCQNAYIERGSGRQYVDPCVLIKFHFLAAAAFLVANRCEA